MGVVLADTLTEVQRHRRRRLGAGDADAIGNRLRRPIVGQLHPVSLTRRLAADGRGRGFDAVVGPGQRGEVQVRL